MKKRETRLVWTVVGEFKQDNRKMLTIACPDCGYEYRIRKTDYHKPRTCRKCRFIAENRKSLGQHRGVGDLTKSFYGHFKNTAKRRGIDFTVSIEYLWQLAEKQDIKCALSGLPLLFPTMTDKNGNPTLVERQRERLGYTLAETASLDRIDSTKPYEEGNVQWTNKYINIMKNGFSQDEFIHLCHRVSELHANPELRQLKGNKK